MNFNWKRNRHSIEYAGVRFLAWFIPKLTRDECMGLAKIFGSVAFFFDRRGREVTLANLEAVFGDQYTLEQRHQIGVLSYQNFARTMIDLFWCPRLLEPANHRFLRVTGVENMPKRGERSAMATSATRQALNGPDRPPRREAFKGWCSPKRLRIRGLGKYFAACAKPSARRSLPRNPRCSGC